MDTTARAEAFRDPDATGRILTRRAAAFARLNSVCNLWPKYIAAWMRRSSSAAVLFAIAALFVIDSVDYLTHEKLHLELFYVFPVAMVAWHISRKAAIGTGVAASLVWLLTDRLVDDLQGPIGIAASNAVLRIAFFSIVAEVIERLRIALHREQWLSSRDPLTEVLNGRAFYDAVATEVERCKRYGHIVSLAYIDVDDFKQVNDRHGHQIGDAVLRHIAGVLTAELRRVDVVARLGGDEFAVMLPETSGPSGCTALEKVQRKLAVASEEGLVVSISVGLVTFERTPRDVEEMLQRADALMYEVKRSGKGRICAEVER